MIHQMDVGLCKLWAVDGQSPEQMPILQARKGTGVIILLQPTGQLRNGCFIKSLQALLGDGLGGDADGVGHRGDNWAKGELAQLVERCDRTAEVRGSSPLFSTKSTLVGR